MPTKDAVPLDPRVEANPWGVIEPVEGGATWQVKTQGRSVVYRHLDGIFYPLTRPILDDQDLLLNLHHANENRYRQPGAAPRTPDDIWQDIRAVIDFDFEDVPAPSGYPPTEEGLRWIAITQTSKTSLDWLETLNEPLALVYGNSD